MSSEKKGFVLYFDACRSLAGLEPAQRGYLLTALYRYAEAASREAVSPAAALRELPELEPAARMAFLFMAGAVQRDTEKWRVQQEKRRAAALERFRGK